MSPSEDGVVVVTHVVIVTQYCMCDSYSIYIYKNIYIYINTIPYIALSTIEDTHPIPPLYPRLL